MPQIDERHGANNVNKWLVLALCCAANFLVYFHRVTPAVMVNELMAEFGGSAASIGVLSSAYFYTYTAMQIPVGFMSDRIGLRFLIGFGTLFAGMSSILFGLSKSMTAAILARALTGLGVSAVLIPSYKMLGLAFGEKFMMANGILMAAGASGGLGASRPLVVLLDSYGWRSSFFVISAISFVVGILCLTFIRSLKEKRYVRVAAGSGGGIKSLSTHFPKALLPGTIAFFKYGPLVAFQGLWGVPFLMDSYGMIKVEASTLMLLLSISTIAGGLLVGPILDRTGIGQRKLLIGSSAAFALCWIPLVLAPAPGVLPFIYLSMGLMGAVDIIVLISINNHIRSTTDERIRGTVMGIINSITFLGGAIYQPVMGLFINRTSEGYTTAFSLGIAGAALSFAATLLLSRKFLN